MFGNCNIEVPVKSVTKILLKDVFNPFYIFQALAMAWWWWIGYIYYDAILFSITALSIVLQVFDIWSNYVNLWRMAYYECDV